MTTLDEKLALVRADAPRSRGSRARSREIGYAEAMREMKNILGDMGRQSRALAATVASAEMGAGLLAGAAALDQAASYAFSACMIYGDERSGGDIDHWMQLNWSIHRDAPKELGGGAR